VMARRCGRTASQAAAAAHARHRRIDAEPRWRGPRSRRGTSSECRASRPCAPRIGEDPPMLSASHRYFHAAADLLGLDAKVRNILLTPLRTVKVELVVEAD